MSKFNDALSTYLGEAEKLGIAVDKALLEKVTKGLGPSIYNADSSKVSSSDPKELERVKQNFLVKKLGLTDGPEADKLIANAIEKLGSSNTNKYRALFYYVIVVDAGKQSVYSA